VENDAVVPTERAANGRQDQPGQAMTVGGRQALHADLPGAGGGRRRPGSNFARGPAAPTGAAAGGHVRLDLFDDLEEPRV
jgi:hypothetical protein